MSVSRFIHVNKETRANILSTFGVSRQLTWLALTFKINSPLARKIRTMALQNGGVMVDPSTSLETFFDYDGTMTQYFKNGAVIIFTKEDGACHILYNGEKVKGFEDVRVSQIESIQKYARSIGARELKQPSK